MASLVGLTYPYQRSRKLTKRPLNRPLNGSEELWRNDRQSDSCSPAYLFSSLIYITLHFFAKDEVAIGSCQTSIQRYALSYSYICILSFFLNLTSEMSCPSVMPLHLRRTPVLSQRLHPSSRFGPSETRLRKRMSEAAESVSSRSRSTPVYMSDPCGHVKSIQGALPKLLQVDLRAQVMTYQLRSYRYIKADIPHLSHRRSGASKDDSNSRDRSCPLPCCTRSHNNLVPSPRSGMVN